MADDLIAAVAFLDDTLAAGVVEAVVRAVEIGGVLDLPDDASAQAIVGDLVDDAAGLQRSL